MEAPVTVVPAGCFRPERPYLLQVLSAGQGTARTVPDVVLWDFVLLLELLPELPPPPPEILLLMEFEIPLLSPDSTPRRVPRSTELQLARVNVTNTITAANKRKNNILLFFI